MSSNGRTNSEAHARPAASATAAGGGGRTFSSWAPEQAPATQISDPQRLASLQRAGLLDSPPEEAFDRLTRMAAQALRAPVALVSLVDDGRQFFKSAVGLSQPLATERQTPLSHSYCQHVVTSGQPLVVADAREHPLLHDNPAIEDYEAIAYCGMPLVDREGRVLGTLCAIDDKPRAWTDEEVSALQDIVRSVIAEVHLRLVSVELADANAALQEFIAVASHDLRNPLSTILGFARFLAEDDLSDEERVEFAQIILNEGRRANRLVSDLLELSKLEVGALRPQRQLIGLGTAVAEAMAGIEPDGVHPDVVEVDVPDGLAVVADGDHLHRVICNLLQNAMAYGAPPISIRARRQGAVVELEVADRGRGVAPEFVPRLFDKFSRSDYSRSEGTGLGLAITAGLVIANGGLIRYEDNRPRGAKFVVEMPGGVGIQLNGSAAAADTVAPNSVA